MKTLKFQDFFKLTESSVEHKELLKSIEGSNMFPREITDKYTIVKEKYPDWKDPNAEQVAKARKKELESQGYTVKLKKWNFIDLARGYSWSVTAIKDKTVTEKKENGKEKVVATVVKPEDVKKVEEQPKEVVEEAPKKKGLTIKQKRHLPQALQAAILKAQGESIHVKKFDEFVNEKVKNFNWMTKHYQVEYKKKGKDIELKSLLVDGEEVKDITKIGSKLYDIIIDHINENLNEKSIEKIDDDFFNKLAKEIDEKYFPDVKYYRDNKDNTNAHYAIELFNNGVLDYDSLIKRLSKSCKDTKENIHMIVSKYIKDFGDYSFRS